MVLMKEIYLFKCQKPWKWEKKGNMDLSSELLASEAGALLEWVSRVPGTQKILKCIFWHPQNFEFY